MNRIWQEPNMPTTTIHIYIPRTEYANQQPNMPICANIDLSLLLCSLLFSSPLLFSLLSSLLSYHLILAVSSYFSPRIHSSWQYFLERPNEREREREW